MHNLSTNKWQLIRGNSLEIDDRYWFLDHSNLFQFHFSFIFFLLLCRLFFIAFLSFWLFDTSSLVLYLFFFFPLVYSLRVVSRHHFSFLLPFIPFERVKIFVSLISTKKLCKFTDRNKKKVFFIYFFFFFFSFSHHHHRLRLSFSSFFICFTTPVKSRRKKKHKANWRIEWTNEWRKFSILLWVLLHLHRLLLRFSYIFGLSETMWHFENWMPQTPKRVTPSHLFSLPLKYGRVRLLCEWVWTYCICFNAVGKIKNRKKMQNEKISTVRALLSHDA